MKVKLLILRKVQQKVLLTLIYDMDLISEGENSKEKIQEMSSTYNDLYLATRGFIAEKKVKYFS